MNDTLDDQAPGTRYAIEYAFIQDIANRSNVYAQRVKDAALGATHNRQSETQGRVWR